MGGTFQPAAAGEERQGGGTFGYTAPEVIFGTRPAHSSQDAWAVGHMLLVMLTKRQHRASNMFKHSVSQSKLKLFLFLPGWLIKAGSKHEIVKHEIVKHEIVRQGVAPIFPVDSPAFFVAWTSPPARYVYRCTTLQRLLTEADHELKATMTILGEEDLLEVGEVK